MRKNLLKNSQVLFKSSFFFENEKNSLCRRFISSKCALENRNFPLNSKLMMRQHKNTKFPIDCSYDIGHMTNLSRKVFYFGRWTVKLRVTICWLTIDEITHVEFHLKRICGATDNNRSVGGNRISSIDTSKHMGRQVSIFENCRIAYTIHALSMCRWLTVSYIVHLRVHTWTTTWYDDDDHAISHRILNDDYFVCSFFCRIEIMISNERLSWVKSAETAIYLFSFLFCLRTLYPMLNIELRTIHMNSVSSSST